MLQSIQNLAKITFILFLGATVLISCDDDTTGTDNEFTVLETLQANEDFSTLVELSDEHELNTVLSDEDITVFAPSNSAIEEEELDEMSDEEIKSLLQYHVVNTVLTYDELADTSSVETASGDTLYFSETDTEITLNEDQAAISADGMADVSNGVIFRVDSVLTPVSE